MTNPVPEDAREAAVKVVQVLREAGHVAYFAGGCVRDQLMGLTPKDYDVATDAPPDKVRSLFPRTQAVGQAFGVILVRLKGVTIEVATFRTEGTYSDGRRPDSVEFTTAENDAKRRDFTINGLFFDPIENRVIDYVGGQDDLKKRTLRAIGNPSERFAEDYLRSLRAVRFASRFNLRFDRLTFDALRDSTRFLPKISAERIAEELRKMLTAPWRQRAYALLFETGVMAAVMTPATASDPVDAWQSVFLHLPSEPAVPFSLALAAMAIDLSGCDPDTALQGLAPRAWKKTVDDLRHRLKLSNDETTDIQNIGQDVYALLSQDDPPLAVLMRFVARPHAQAARRLMSAMAAVGIASSNIRRLSVRLALLDGVDCSPDALLTGDDLLAMGHKAGPAFKRVLDEVYDAQLESRVRTADEAKQMAERLLRA